MSIFLWTNQALPTNPISIVTTKTWETVDSVSIKDGFNHGMYAGIKVRGKSGKGYLLPQQEDVKL